MLPEGYVIRLVRREELALLPDIERRANTRFDDYGFDDVMAEILTPQHALEQGLTEQRLWVVVTQQGDPVGFALARVVDRHAHLDELDVLPEHGRRGLGSALVETACAWGRANGFRVITLTTLSNIPWNGPFYSRLGFRILTADELSEAQRAILDEDVERGLPAENRVMMQREL